MGKAGRWLRSILAGKKDGGRGRDKKALPLPQQQGAAATSPREKKRWSFRRPAPSSTSAHHGKPAVTPSPLSREASATEEGLAGNGKSVSGRELDEQSEHAAEVAVAAADVAVMAAAQAAAAVARLTEAEEEEESDVLASWLVEEAAAARIQATFRGYLARKALCALRGLVKLQALIRGQLVRRQATATLRRMQALLEAQSRLRAQRARMLDHDHQPTGGFAAAPQRRSPQHPRRRSSYEMDRSVEEHVKEMDAAVDPARRGRSSCSAAAGESRDRRLAEYYCYDGQSSPAPSSSAAFAGADLLTPRTYSGHLDELLAFDPAAMTARSSPYVHPYDDDDADHVVPSYMANTQSSRAKARSQSAPKQRTADALERQPSSRRRGGGGIPAGAAQPSRKSMQRSSSHIGVPAFGYQYQYQHQQPWAGVRLDRSSASLVGSECGSTSTVLTAATVGYCRSLVGFEVHRGQY
ncbi:hypothetical protein EJB05_22782, partial [Eragrostis curvula]